jgi:hypothetical protein
MAQVPCWAASTGLAVVEPVASGGGGTPRTVAEGSSTGHTMTNMPVSHTCPVWSGLVRTPWKSQRVTQQFQASADYVCSCRHPRTLSAAASHIHMPVVAIAMLGPSANNYCRLQQQPRAVHHTECGAVTQQSPTPRARCTQPSLNCQRVHATANGHSTPSCLGSSTPAGQGHSPVSGQAAAAAATTLPASNAAGLKCAFTRCAAW